MKQQILTCTVVLCIAFVAGCNNNADKPGTAADSKNSPEPTVGKHLITILPDSLRSAEDAIINYGAYCREKNYNIDSTIRGWLIRGRDFLLAMGLDTTACDSIMKNARHPYIHAYIGLSPLPRDGMGFNQQLYLIGAQSETIAGSRQPTITDFPEDGVYNLTMPCPKACVNRPDSSLFAAFDTGYFNKPRQTKIIK